MKRGVSVQQLVDHIKTARDVDPWAKEMAEDLLIQKEAEAEIEGGGITWFFVCGECHGTIDDNSIFCKHCGRKIQWK